MDGPGTESAATYTIDDLLETMVALGASDLHLAVGSHPVIRLNGSLDRLDQFPRLSADDTQRLLYRILSTEQQKNLGSTARSTFRTRSRASRAFASTSISSARASAVRSA